MRRFNSQSSQSSAGDTVNDDDRAFWDKQRRYQRQDVDPQVPKSEALIDREKKQQRQRHDNVRVKDEEDDIQEEQQHPAPVLEKSKISSSKGRINMSLSVTLPTEENKPEPKKQKKSDGLPSATKYRLLEYSDPEIEYFVMIAGFLGEKDIYAVVEHVDDEIVLPPDTSSEWDFVPPEPPEPKPTNIKLRPVMHTAKNDALMSLTNFVDMARVDRYLGHIKAPKVDKLFRVLLTINRQVRTVFAKFTAAKIVSYRISNPNFGKSKSGKAIQRELEKVNIAAQDMFIELQKAGILLDGVLPRTQR